jgi:shikimate kinase
MNVYLIGPRGCGKSSVGRLLAEQIGWPWLDLDERIQETSGRTIAEIFESHGQGHFRELESQALSQLAGDTADRPHVISLGGGAVLRPENRRVLETTGYTILLMADPSVLVSRVLNDPASAGQRPPLTGPSESEWSLLEETQHVLSLRLPVYQQASNLKLDTTHLTPPEVTAQILRWMRRLEHDLLPESDGQGEGAESGAETPPQNKKTQKATASNGEDAPVTPQAKALKGAGT